MPIYTEGGNVQIEGGYNDVARDLYYYTDSAVHQDNHVNYSSNGAPMDSYRRMSSLVALKYAQPNSHADNGPGIQNTGYGPSIVLC